MSNKARKVQGDNANPALGQDIEVGILLISAIARGLSTGAIESDRFFEALEEKTKGMKPLKK